MENLPGSPKYYAKHWAPVSEPTISTLPTVSMDSNTNARFILSTGCILILYYFFLTEPKQILDETFGSELSLVSLNYLS